MPLILRSAPRPCSDRTCPPTPRLAFSSPSPEQLRIVRDWEPQLRASLRVSLLPGGEQPPLRGGRAVGWFVDALAPLAATHPTLDLRRLAIHLRAVAGIESYVWLTDVAGLSAEDAIEIMRTNATTLLSGLIAPPDVMSSHTRHMPGSR